MIFLFCEDCTGWHHKKNTYEVYQVYTPRCVGVLGWAMTIQHIPCVTVGAEDGGICVFVTAVADYHRNYTVHYRGG